MKLLLINHEYPPVGGGAATATQAIAHNLRSLGQDITVCTSQSSRLATDTTEDGIRIRRIKCTRKHVDRSNLFEMLIFTVTALFSFPFILATDRPDALIIFFALPSGPLGLVGKVFFGIPYVISLRGGDVPGLVPELNWIHRMIAPVRRLVLKHACAVVANSEALRKLSEAADNSPVLVVPNGVDTELFQPNVARSTSSSLGTPLRVLFVGRFHEQKNLEFLLRELARLPQGSFKLQLVGNGPEEKYLRELAEELGIARYIMWSGWLPRSTLPQVYRAADCFVNPSFYEGMPNVVLEAMACGLPVIASKIAGHDELVVHGETGLLFELDEPDALVRALKSLMGEDDTRSKFGSAGRFRVLSQFSWRSVSESYLRLLSLDGVA